MVGASALPLNAAVTAGGIAVIGYNDFQDSFSLVATEHIQAGEVIYLTNNGWSNLSNSFNGAHPAQGAGNESIIQLTVTEHIAPGTVISSTISNSSWSWNTSGLISGQVGGIAAFSQLALDNVSDQIYIFQGLANNPLANPTNFIYAMHFGSSEFATWSDSEDIYDGAIPPGLSMEDNTAFLQTDLFAHGDPEGNNSAWGLNLSSPSILALQNSTGSKAEWLAAITSASNWGAGMPAPGGGGLAIHAPEPSRVILVLAGLCALIGKRRR